MKQQYHISDKGPGRCEAQPGKCPVSKDDPSVTHAMFDSPEDAQKAYEKRMEGEGTKAEQPPMKKKRVTLSKEERAAYNEAKKKFDHDYSRMELDGETALTVAKYGNEAMLKKLSKANSDWHADGMSNSKRCLTEALQEGHRRSDSEELRQAFEQNRQYRHPVVNDEVAEKELNTTPAREHLLAQIASSSEVNEDLRQRAWDKVSGQEYHTAIVLDSKAPLKMRLASANKDNNVRWMNDELSAAVLRDPDLSKEYPVDTKVGSHALVRVSLGSSDPEQLRAASRKLNAGADDEIQNLAGVALLRNSNTPDDVKQEVIKKNATAASYDKVQHSLDTLGAMNVPRQIRGGRVFYDFSPYDVHARKLERKDLDTYVRYFQSDALNMTSYDPETGVYSGFIN